MNSVKQSAFIYHEWRQQNCIEGQLLIVELSYTGAQW